MSGDVQPRKRKDKKRKKDDSTEQIPTPPQVPISTNQNEDLNIHVHKEDGTGGGICAKIIFFLLFSALAILIGLIITEHRGLTDLDTVDQESRFSQLFEGWIDNSISHDDDGDHVVSSLEDDDHGDDETESHEEHHEEDEEEEEEEEGQDEGSEEVAQTEEEEDEEDEEEEASEQVPQTEEDEDDEEEEEEEEDEETTADDEPNVESEEAEEENDDDESELQDINEDEESDENAAEDEEAQDVDNSVEEEGQDDEDENEDDDDKPVASEENDVAEQSEEEASEETKTAEQQLSKENEDEDEEDKKEKEEGEKEEEDDQQNSKSVNVRDDNEPEESDSDKQSDAETYEYENITNKDDVKIKQKIDEAHKNIQNNTAYAIKLFDVLLQNYSSSPRSLYGKAQALDVLADQKRSNEILQKAIATYFKLLDLEDVPDPLFEAAAERCINRLRFMGNYNRAVDVHLKLIARFPEEPKYRNQLVVSYLTVNRVKKARMMLQETLSKYPNDGFALVHYGFILKTVDNNLHESISYLERGISTRAPGVIDGRFYFHLGDALARLGRTEEAMKVYEDGVEQKLFLSKYQRSLYNVDRLKGQPWWKKEETPYGNLYSVLEANWQKIRDEGISVMNKNDLFQSESENLKDTGDWKQFELFARGQKNVENCKKCPITCKIIDSIPDARGCKRGQTKFSVMHPTTHVWPHCGPTNCRLRVHLGLKVPPRTYIRVADEIRSWKNGEVLIFDDSFEHEVWHNGTTFRLVLIVDVWHPELTSLEKRTLSPI
jgi:aspartate beta-hydroxylase